MFLLCEIGQGSLKFVLLCCAMIKEIQIHGDMMSACACLCSLHPNKF